MRLGSFDEIIFWNIKRVGVHWSVITWHYKVLVTLPVIAYGFWERRTLGLLCSRKGTVRDAVGGRRDRGEEGGRRAGIGKGEEGHGRGVAGKKEQESAEKRRGSLCAFRLEMAGNVLLALKIAAKNNLQRRRSNAITVQRNWLNYFFFLLLFF